MLNHITIMGRLTKDPELRYTQNQTAVATFSVAVERDYSGNDGNRQTDFLNCVAWRKSAEFVNRYFGKGSMIIVEGRLESRNYEDKNGNKRTAFEVNAEKVHFGESKRSSENTESQGFTEIEGDESDLPF